MAIDIDLVNKNEEGKWSKIFSYVFEDLGGVEVAWMRYENGEIDDACLLTDADFLDEATSEGDKADLHQRCEDAKRRAIAIRMEELRREHGVRWSRMPLKEVVFEVVQLAWNGTWVGQEEKGTIYVRTILDLLKPLPFENDCEGGVWCALAELEEEERIELNGGLIEPYTQRFRFPKEIRELLRYIIEEPYGWPNGEVADFSLSAIERAIGEHTGFKHGRSLVGEENFPRLAPRHLMWHGLAWLTRVINRMEVEGPEIVEPSPDLESLAGQLEVLAKRTRQLRVKHEEKKLAG